MAGPQLPFPAGSNSLRKRVSSPRLAFCSLTLALAFLPSKPARAQSQQQYVYASGGTTVSGFAKASTTGVLTGVTGSPFSEGSNGGALAVDPLGRFLYILNPSGNTVSVFAIDHNTGVLTTVPNSPFTAMDATTPQVLAAEATGKFLYVGNHQGSSLNTNFGVIDIYSIDSNTGALTSASAVPVIGPFNPPSMVTDAKGRFLYAYQGPNSATGDAGGTLDAFQIDPLTGLLSPPTSSCSASEAGRSLAIDPKLRFLFAGRSNLQGHIDACTISPLDGSLQLVNTITLPNSGEFPDAMAVDSGGKFLYAVTSFGAVRGYSIDQTSGALTELPISPFQGITLGKSIVADPQGPYLYATDASGVVGLQADSSTGGLTQITSVSASGINTGTTNAIAISGTAVQPSSGPVATFVPTSVDFGSVLVGATSGTSLVHIVNSGDQTLAFSGISVTGLDSKDFSQTNTCGPSLAPNQNCVISVTFTPSAAGTRTAALSVSDNAPGSPQGVALTGQGVSPQPAVTLAPGSLTFPGTLQGSTSSPQTVAVTNSGQATLTISSVALSGLNPSDFSQTNDCSSLAPGSSCTLHVTFAPLASGQRSAAIEITDNAPGSPHTVSLSGTGEAPFSLAPTGSNPTSLTITAGQTAQYILQFTPAAGFTGSVTFMCTGAPAEASCQVSPSSVQVNTANSTLLTVSVATTARGFAAPSSRVPRDWPFVILRWLLLFFLTLAILFLRRLSREAASPETSFSWCRVPLSVALLVIGGISGCGGGSGSVASVQPPPQMGTPPGTSTISVTATHNTITEQIQLTLIVK